MGALAALQFENLPLGFRFKPTDVELIDHYLRMKINGKENEVSCIKEVDICRVEPWDLPDLSAIKTNDSEWFFFCPRDRKYPSGQRSNRATEAGYWKATGKDRNIKSRKLGLIGMKKTLVFYTGRAPKGKRTHWVIHEYRTTLKELNGSHPGQGAFVLCRLFKKDEELKQDDHDDGSHTDEVETNICSPNPTNITHEDMRSEPAVVQASPVSVEQSVDQRMTFGNCVKTSGSLTSEIIYPDRQMNEELTPEVDSHAIEGNHYNEDAPELYLQWLDEAVGMAEIFPAEIGDSHNGLKLQDINVGRDPLSGYLDSVLVNSDALVCKEAGGQGAQIVQSDIWNYSAIKESGLCSGSEVVQQQHDLDYINRMSNDDYYNEPKGNMDLVQHHPLADDDDIFSDAALFRFCMQEPIDYTSQVTASFLNFGDGAQIVGNNEIDQSGIHSRQVPAENFIRHGTALRGIHLHMVEEKESKSTVNEDPTYDNFFCLEDLSENMVKGDENESSVDNTCEVGTEIKIRPRIQRSQPSNSKFVEQGNARRRLRLQKKPSVNHAGRDDDTKPPLFADIRNLSEKVSDDDSDCEPDRKPTSFKRPTSPMHLMVKVVMVVFLFLACFGLWIARNVYLLSS